MTLKTELQKLYQESIDHSHFNPNDINSVNAWLTARLKYRAAAGSPGWSAYVGLEVLGRQSSNEERNQFIEIVKRFAKDHHLTFENSKFHDDILLIIRWRE